MFRALLIYHNSAEGSKYALRIILDDDGKISFIPGHEYYQEAMDLLSKGAGSMIEKRRVTPDEGEAYLVAVWHMLERSTAWSAVQANP